jgi:hypothetical protein
VVCCVHVSLFFVHRVSETSGLTLGGVPFSAAKLSSSVRGEDLSLLGLSDATDSWATQLAKLSGA